jgi:DNA-binding GntR family transcriptional regulator
MYTIDRDSPIPVYYQIQQDLRKRIKYKEWELNQLMPSETELIKYYDVSRVTLRQALAELEKDGLIKRYRGKGAFITARNPTPFVHDLNYELVSGKRLVQQGYSMEANILTLTETSPALSDIQEKLHLDKEHNHLVFIKRLFLLDGKPIAIGKSWLPAGILPGFVENGMIENSLSRTLAERYHIKPVRVDDYVEVVRSTQAESELLNSTYDVPLILIQGISYLEDGTPIEYSQTHWLGDGVRFHLSLHHTKEGFVMGDRAERAE